MHSFPISAIRILHEQYGPVAAHFTPTQVPESGAPEHIKQQWVDVPLPVRQSQIGRLAVRFPDILTGEVRDIDEPIGVAGIEAVHALWVAGRQEAAEYWTRYQLGLFVFRTYEGRLEPLK
ncbi:MAG: hypothetical protein JWM81_416 [Candidatus Saccharibacteria bacterium]|nr:hypothetical protein [Candidatus Saccharibacteria bacterium]